MFGEYAGLYGTVVIAMTNRSEPRLPLALT